MPASDAQRLSTADRRTRLLAMRLAGYTWDQCATRLGYCGKAAACKDFARAMEATRATVRQRAEDLVEVELLRYDRLQAGSWPRAIAGDPKSADIVLKISDRRIRLLKLDEDKRSTDNAVDEWLDHIAAGGTLDDDDAAALAAVA